MAFIKITVYDYVCAFIVMQSGFNKNNNFATALFQLSDKKQMFIVLLYPVHTIV